VESPSDADLVIVNTCTVTQAADLEGRRLVRRLAARLGPGRVVVTGCSAQRDPRPFAEVRGVRLVAGNSHKERLLELVAGPGGGPAAVLVDPPRGAAPRARVAALSSGGRSSNARAYLRVQDGCSQTCTFCTLPAVRGTSASVPLDLVCREARLLAAAGHGEIVLTGAHLGSYGYDLQPRVPLAGLIEAVLEAAPAARVRLSSLEPRFVSRELLALLACEPRLCPHLHLPLQSGDDRVLERMARAYRAAPYERRAWAAAEAVRAAAGAGAPGIGLGSDFLVGFPGEDDDAFAATAALVERLPFTYGHVFPYSDRPGTPAAGYDGRVRPDVARRRAAVLRRLLRQKGAEFRRAHVGRAVEIVAERVEPAGGPAGDWQVCGTSERFVPVAARGRGTGPPRPGARVAVRVTAAAEDGLRGEVQGEA
jgi:threonylcarbamoyladenosine tRNA methylthiotransferase MtaB